jgi:hypothetical protein
MERGERDARSGDGGEKSSGESWLKVSAADLCFVVCVLIISAAVGIAFENALAAGLLAVFGGMVSWAVWKEFKYRVLPRKEPER